MPFIRRRGLCQRCPCVPKLFDWTLANIAQETQAEVDAPGISWKAEQGAARATPTLHRAGDVIITAPFVDYLGYVATRLQCELVGAGLELSAS